MRRKSNYWAEKLLCLIFGMALWFILHPTKPLSSQESIIKEQVYQREEIEKLMQDLKLTKTVLLDLSHAVSNNGGDVKLGWVQRTLCLDCHGGEK